MWNEEPQTHGEQEALPRLGGGAGFFADYFWFALKNVVGWLLLASSLVLGPVPGPGGIVVFLIGFGMVSFPGKRRLMVRIFRGRRFRLNGVPQHTGAIAAAILLALVAVAWFVWRDAGRWQYLVWTLARGQRVGIYAAAVVGAWAVVWGLMFAGNWLVGVFPKIRRTVRPKFRKWGIDLLPPRIRRRARLADGSFAWQAHDTGEIIRIHERHVTRLSNAWNKSKPWLRRGLGVGITVAIFAWMLRPVVAKWDQVGDRVKEIDWAWFAVAAVMFAAFLFVFRVLSWRKILSGFGHKLPLAPATRIWSTSELARYLPGVIWQVVGRVYLVKPYGVSGTVCSASQILELIVFVLANVLVAVSCLLWFGYRMDGYAKSYLWLAVGLILPLMSLLHPKVFYTLLTKYMTWRGKQLPARRVRGRTLTVLTIWAIAGLLWQSFALWIVTQGPLDLPWQKWWIIAGAYCLAWCAGFIAFWAPGGLGVREFVFVTATAYILPNALPPHLRANLGDPEVLFGFLAFIGLLLRLWTIAGELILTGMAYALDYRGALGKPDAPGRVAHSVTVEA